MEKQRKIENLKLLKNMVDVEVRQLHFLFSSLKHTLIKTNKKKKMDIYGSEEEFVYRKGPPSLELRKKIEDDHHRFEDYVEKQACFLTKHRRVGDCIDYMKKKLEKLKNSRSEKTNTLNKLVPFLKMSNLIQKRKQGKIQTFISIYNPALFKKSEESQYLVNISKFDGIGEIDKNIVRANGDLKDEDEEEEEILAFELVIIHKRVERILIPIINLLSTSNCNISYN